MAEILITLILILGLNFLVSSMAMMLTQTERAITYYMVSGVALFTVSFAFFILVITSFT